MKTTARKKPAEKKPAEKKPAEKKPAEKKPAGKPAAKKPRVPAARQAVRKREKLPEWDLSDFYSSLTAPEVERDFVLLEKRCGDFAEAYEGRVDQLDAAALARAIREYEEIQELSGRLASYAGLAFAKNVSDPVIARFYQNTQERLTRLSSQILFFGLSINTLDDRALARMLRASALSAYEPWLRDTRAFKPYQLPDALEKLLLEKSVAGRAAWTRLFDESIARLTFPVGKKNLSSAEAFNLLSSADAGQRKAAALSIGRVLGDNAGLFTLITNTLAKDKEIEDNWRGFSQPISSRNVSNYIEDEVVDALLAAVKQSYPRLSHRYYRLKAKWFGVKQLDYWDRNAPLPGDTDRTYSWSEARELVLTSYAHFSPELARLGKTFFDKPWIDAAVTPGKSPGAFAHPTVPSLHPYLLVNFQGRARDVMTLAHELGHGVHQMLAAGQGALQSDTPLTLAETASVFGEQLTFREMIRREKTAKRRKRLIAAKVEDMLNTVVRQIAFCEFEKRLHAERRRTELTADAIGAIWMDVQSQSLGPGIRLHGDYRHYWMYIPHFIHSPFYVYAYAFGDCLVNSLYAVYEKNAENGANPAFEKHYLAMLEAGGTLRHKELLRPFGLDATRPDFWQGGLDIIAEFIEELA